MNNMNTLFPAEDQPSAYALAELGFTNPFGSERIDLEKQILGDSYTPAFHIWVITPTHQGFSPNLIPLANVGESLIASAQTRIEQGYRPTDKEWQLYGDVALYVLYYRYEGHFYKVVTDDEISRTEMPFYPRFLTDWRQLFANTPLVQQQQFIAEHMFALLFQIRRAFHFIFRAILGTSSAASSLRMAVWQSIFSHDMRRYQRSLYQRIHEVSTLILGESGTGKELVASAIGLARYIPFSTKTKTPRFESDYLVDFQAVHLAALPLTLLESELFGHRKGSFTGATGDRVGYLETTHQAQTVFLDEIGELPAEVQVKLLRVLQGRQFQRVGDNNSRTFYGKIVSATHRDLAAAIEAGKFRSDLYYRLCSDIIRTPSLADQLADNQEELYHLVTLVTGKIVNADIANDIAKEAHTWISQHLPNYTWRGNMRELEQCVRSIIIHGSYHPNVSKTDLNCRQQFAHAVSEGQLDNDTLLGRYYALVYAQTGSYEATAQRLGTNWRTVKSNMDIAFLEQLKKV